MPETRRSYRCLHCGAPLEQAGRGRRRLYCGSACRKAAQRSRDAAWTFLEEEAPQASAPLAWAQGGAGTPAPDRSSEADVANTILAAAAVCAELRRHAIAAAPRVAGKCGAVADALDAALAREFGEVFT